MRVRLEDKWVRTLSALPETGMGYQQVDVTLRSGRRVPRLLVFNAELLDWPDDQPPIQSKDIMQVLPQRSPPPRADANR